MSLVSLEAWRSGSVPAVVDSFGDVGGDAKFDAGPIRGGLEGDLRMYLCHGAKGQ